MTAGNIFFFFLKKGAEAKGGSVSAEPTSGVVVQCAVALVCSVAAACSAGRVFAFAPAPAGSPEVLTERWKIMANHRCPFLCCMLLGC